MPISRLFRFTWLLLIAGMMLGAGLFQNGVCIADENSGGNLKEEMRMPWSGPEDVFLREWLLCGAFPSPARAGNEHPRQGYDIDYLKDMGGEAAVRPVDGQTVELEDGSTAMWTEYTSDQDAIDLLQFFRDQQNTNVVAYGYTTITRDEAGKGVLALGSDDSVKVWLNGELVHSNAIARGVQKDEDIAPVSFRKGDNSLLIKVENGAGGWGFVVRVLSESQALALERDSIRPRIEPSDRPDLLVVKTDTYIAGSEEIRVDIVAPGGKIMADAKAGRGQKIEFRTGEWPDGPYEIRVSKQMPEDYRVFSHLPWYKGDWMKQVRALIDMCENITEYSEDPADMRYLVVRDLVVDRLGGDMSAEFAPDQWNAIHSPLMEHREIEMGDSACIRPHGFIRLAWRDMVDDSPQFTRAYLPPDYDPEKKWPMVVNLHGYNGANPEYINWWSVTNRHNSIAERHNVIFIEPHGRGNTGYQGIGELDVLKAIQTAEEKFSVDEDRIYLMGYSMGGGGTWYVGTRHTDIFAAIGPIYGGWDYHTWLDEDGLANLTPRQRFEAESESSFAQAESLLNTPVFVNHGDSDPTVDVDFSRYAVRMLQRWGYKLRYWEHPGGIHGALGCEDELVRWFMDHKLNRNPRHVRVRAAYLESAASDWVRVEQREDPFEFILVDARIGDRHTIRLDTQNVLQILMTPGDEIIDRSAPVRVIWNGEDTGMHRFSFGAIVLQANGYEPGDLYKTPELSGPINDFITTPFAIVLGTASEDAKMRRFCDLLAEKESDEWDDWQHVEPRFFLDTEITDEQIREYSLRLIGGPDENLVTRQLIQNIPLMIEDDKITIGEQSFDAEDAAVSMIYPHPLNPERYVCIAAGNSPAGMLLAGSLPENVDFVIADAVATDDTPFEKVCVAFGSFNCNWQYDERYVLRGDPDERSKPTVRRGAKEIERIALMYLLSGVWEQEEQEWAETFSAPMSTIAEELEVRGQKYGFTQKVEDNSIQWLGDDGDIAAMFCIISDASDLNAVRQVYERIHTTGCPLTYAIVHQTIDGEGTYDIFQLSADRYMSHDWRVAIEGGAASQVPEEIRGDLMDIFSSSDQQENEEWADIFSLSAPEMAEEFGEIVAEYKCTQKVADGAILWYGAGDSLEAMFYVISDVRDLESFRRVYELIDSNASPLTYVIVPVGAGEYDIFRLSLASYMEHCNRVP